MIPKINPKYNALERLEKWDKETQYVIKRRMRDEIGETEAFGFLTLQEGRLLKELIDILVPQSQQGGFRIKIAQTIDKSLSDKREGVRYGNNPWKGEFYKKGLAELAVQFPKISLLEVENIFARDNDDFLKNFVGRALRDAVIICYSHPGVWNAIGFPGPAYPEGYAYLDCGKRDKWEPEYKVG